MKIGCILVLYNPDIHLLKDSIEAIYQQVDMIYLSDNSTQHIELSFLDTFLDKCYYSKMCGNVGIASAQNYGINYFIKDKYDYVIFLDQDSVAPPNIVSELLNALSTLEFHQIKVGALGPRAVNRQTNKIYKGKVKKGRIHNDNITEVNSLISSGSIVPVKNFIEVGLMESDLFIDAVDYEWCWRGKYLVGFRYFIVENVKLSHQFGEGDKSFLGIKDILIPTPFRCYYLYRNYFFLVRRKYVSTYWKLSRLVILFCKFFYLTIFISPRFQYLKRICRGIKNGLLNKK